MEASFWQNESNIHDSAPGIDFFPVLGSEKPQVSGEELV